MELFFNKFPENGDFNQYWYSPKTISVILEELLIQGGKMAFLSTPSLYSALPTQFQENSKIFDFDRLLSSYEGYIFYDFNDPENIPEELCKTFDYVIIDPPFITSEVWIKYSITAKKLLKEGRDINGIPYGKIIGTTVYENSELLSKLLGLTATAFQPSIPNLVYQYHLFTNYPSQTFSKKNPEIPE